LCNKSEFNSSILMKEKFTERIILIKALQGNKKAFGYIFDKYNKKIYRFIFFKVSKHEAAEDLTSQVFLKAWEYIINKNKIDNLQAFLYQVARNTVIDYYRSKEREELPLIYEDKDTVSQEKIVFLDRELDGKIDKEKLLKIINNLRGQYREVITLRYVEEYSINEISKILNKSKVNIRVMIHRALKDIKEMLTDQKNG